MPTAKSYSIKEWEAKRGAIERMYAEERLSLSEVTRRLGQMGFHVK